jgi:hypothetical protein
MDLRDTRPAFKPGISSDFAGYIDPKTKGRPLA